LLDRAAVSLGDEDLQERLAALTQVGGAGNQILPSILMEPAATVHQPAAAPQPASAPEGAAVAGQRPADATQHEQRSPVAAGQPTAEISAPAPAPELTELWLATTPFPAIERSPVAEGGSEAPVEATADEAVLDARLAAAVRQTLNRIRFSKPGEQPVEHPAAAAPAPNAAETADEHGVPGETVEASFADDAAEAVTARGADGEHDSETAETHPGSNVRALEPLDAGVVQHYAPGADAMDRPARMEPVTSVVAANGSPIAHDADDMSAATAPREISEPQLTTR
jgi:hypothetical protein